VVNAARDAQVLSRWRSGRHSAPRLYSSTGEAKSGSRDSPCASRFCIHVQVIPAMRLIAAASLFRRERLSFGDV
jgi:hypothetical protein